MDKKSLIYTVDQLVAKTITGRNREEVSRERAERFKNVKPLITKEEINAWIEEERRKWQQKNQQQ